MTTTITPDITRLYHRCREDPVVFYREFLGCELFDKQREIVRSVVRNRRTAACGANSTGKDYTTGRLLLWWLNCHYPSKVILTGPTYRQVADIVWREARAGFRGRIGPLGGHMYDKDPRYELDDEWFALGFSTDDPDYLQGFHSPHLLVIITEAHGMSQQMMDAVKRLNPERLILTGNPLATGGEFYDAFHGNRELYNCISISAFDTPNLQQNQVVIPGMVTAEDVEERRVEYGEDSPMYRASVLGEFPDDIEDALVRLTDAIAAKERTLEPDGPAILGVDVARGGEDASVIYYRRGAVARNVHRSTGRSTMELVGRIGELIESDPSITFVVVDDTGVGGGVTDRLKELLPDRVTLIPFIAGSAPQDKRRFFNRTAEAWWGMRDAFRSGNIDIESGVKEDKRLIAQVTTRKYTIQSDRTIRLESKDDIRKDGRRSPDEADALAQTFDPRIRRVPEPVVHDLYTIPRRPEDNPLGLDLSDPKYQDRR
jgi:phage terminase large subunit